MHSVLRDAYQILDSNLDRTIGGAWQTFKWRLNYWRSKIPPFDDLISHPHRRYVVNAVLAHDPISVTEVGCGRGANLFLLGERKPDLWLSGSDVSPTAVKDARRHLQSVQLGVGSVSDLDHLPPRSIDVVLSDAVMMYVPPNEIARSIAAMRRVASRAVVISGWHGEPHYDESSWVYDFRELGPAQIAPFPPDAWNDVRWKKYGAIIEYPPSNA